MTTEPNEAVTTFHCAGTGGYDDANPCTECGGSGSCIAGCFEGMTTDD